MTRECIPVTLLSDREIHKVSMQQKWSVHFSRSNSDLNDKKTVLFAKNTVIIPSVDYADTF